MQYELTVEDFSLDLEIEMKSSDFDLLSDIQNAIAEIVEIYKDESYLEIEEDEEDEEEEDEEEDEEEEDEEEEEDVIGSQGTTIIINR
jgi:hypothetical protein